MRWVYCLGVVSTLCVSALWADADEESCVAFFGRKKTVDPDQESRVALLECKMKAAHDDMAYDCRKGARFASGRPGLDSYGFWAIGNVLYWTAYEGGTEIAYYAEPGIFSFPVPTKVKSVSFNWDVGYRVGAGWVSPHDNMEISALFTRVEPEGNFSMNATAPNTINGVILPDILAATGGFAEWNVKYSVIDVEFARSYFLSRYFYMRPYFGSRTAWVMQSADISFSGSAPVTAHLRNDFVGNGLRAGSDSKWFFARHWNFFLGASASALFGGFTVATGAHGGDIGDDDVKSSAYKIVPMAQMQMGLGWETSFACSSSQLAINVGYELNYLWRQNQLPVLENLPSPVYGARQSQDLAFHGLTVDVELAF
ncbi:MAG: Lpg1974 family pore-forming outer membrane protein [Chlamydiales bacterium]|nr:Lpg1974 family pore-forming outer membrane protein [Chlamydiales bacterium]